MKFLGQRISTRIYSCSEMNVVGKLEQCIYGVQSSLPENYNFQFEICNLSSQFPSSKICTIYVSSVYRLHSILSFDVFLRININQFRKIENMCFSCEF